MMIYHREKCNFIPVTDPFVRQVWQEFVAPDFNIQIEAVRRRGWHVLFVAESVITETREAFLEALQSRGIDELLICAGDSTAAMPDEAGWVSLARDGLLVLQDTATINIYYVTDRRQQFFCLQYFDDMYLLAADLAFIEEVHRCSFKTALEQTLDMSIYFKETEEDPGWIFKTCRRYRDVLPPGVSCTPPYITKESVLSELEQAQLALPAAIKELIELRSGERVFAPAVLRRFGWSCVPLSYPYYEWVFDWACEAERLADAARGLGYAKLEAFLLGDANEPAAYRAPATRDGMLAFMALMFKGPVVVTGAGADFAVLGSPSGFVLACGPRPLLLRIGGHSTEVPSWRYDNVLSRANHLEPQLEELLSEVLLEYMELG